LRATDSSSISSMRSLSAAGFAIPGDVAAGG